MLSRRQLLWSCSRASTWAFVLLCQCASQLSITPTGHAQDVAQETVQEPGGYRETVDEAIREFSVHNYEEARSLFQRAHQLYPNARTFRGIGLAEYEMRKYVDCIGHLESALNSTFKPLTAELRADTERVLKRANNFVGRVVLDIKPGAARVVLDDVPLEQPVRQPLLLQMGDHVLQVQAPGFVSETRKFSVQGAEQKTLTIILASLGGATSAPATTATRPWYKSPWLWGSVGVVVAGAAAGTAVALTREDKTEKAYGGSASKVFDGP